MYSKLQLAELISETLTLSHVDPKECYLSTSIDLGKHRHLSLTLAHHWSVHCSAGSVGTSP